MKTCLWSASSSVGCWALPAFCQSRTSIQPGLGRGATEEVRREAADMQSGGVHAPDGVDANAELAERHGHGVGETEHGALAGRVGLRVGLGLKSPAAAVVRGVCQTGSS